ncbi:Putative peptidoglycan hydrolase YvbX, NOT involved in spore germination [Candidatus Syntrophocurvum alkaliphilum]|uniref:Peptidoglycan hydrolase YvbX, NOT involved in spore germination n=1 Tax=Candidatus Syntrophocurvum alkaliphilum TaxID=2293317 RepID=A0A6I6D816_9FIRM|nr:glycosyl hydrolase family 18 protein [Candidatus Syntrophocurvum alkaliphilum]QGT98747.1 Putative peptidoglycan hydrolase YvbX, NOT involved in spore germination [Candidatus Syntrophocurvum alkaliphilum]
MRKKVSLLLILSLVLLSFAITGFINPGPSININGEQRSYDLPNHIVDNRTMVPVRFFVEDKVFDGKIEWNNELRKVDIQLQDTIIELIVDNKNAKVNGKTINLDVAPYIFQNRTYVPLRFISEAVEAEVGWNDSKREVTIDFENKSNNPMVFAYYYFRAFEEYKENAHLFTDVAFRWLETNGRGDLFYEYQDDYEEILQFSHEQGINTHASVMLFDPDQLNQLLRSPENRARLINNLIQEVQSYNYDGVNIDFEFLKPEDAPYLNIFLEELKYRLPADKTLSVAVFGRTANDRWPIGYDYQRIGEIADLVAVMSYDYRYRTSEPGPVAPLWWVAENISYFSSIMPEEKILIGLATYGYDWGAGQPRANVVSANSMTELRSQYYITEHFSEEHYSPYFTYRDHNNVSRQIWMENERSLQAKYDLVMDNDLAGVMFWRIGTGFTDLYNMLEKN